jgi:hypothetical protein
MFVLKNPVCVLCLACLLPLAFPAIAQEPEPRKYALSAGYAYMRTDTSAGALSLQGISFSVARNMNNWLAVVGDLGGYHLEGFAWPRFYRVRGSPRAAADLGTPGDVGRLRQCGRLSSHMTILYRWRGPITASM